MIRDSALNNTVSETILWLERERRFSQGLLTSLARQYDIAF